MIDPQDEKIDARRIPLESLASLMATVVALERTYGAMEKPKGHGHPVVEDEWEDEDEMDK